MDFMKAAASKLVKEIISLGSSSVSGELTDDLVKRMLKDMDIKSAIELMNESVISREWMIETDELEHKEQALEIQKRFNNMNMSRILKDMLKAEVKKKSIFEISFDNMAINDLVLLPNKYIGYDKEVGWKIKTRDTEIIIENENNKFLICINNGSLENIQGESELEPLVKPFLAKENLENKLNAIIEKYGDIITVFAYEPPLETASKEEKDKRYNSVEEQAKQLKAAKGKDVLAVPASGEKPLNNFVEFIKLDDLKPEIYLQLQEAKEKAIQKYIIGSTLVTGVDGNSGNRALGEVHNEQKELKINAKIKKIRDWFQKLIEIDAELYGYDSRNFYFKFVKELDEKETLELEEKKAEVLSKKMDAISKLYASGYALTDNKLAEILGMETTDLMRVENTVNNSTDGIAKIKYSEFAKEDKFFKKREKIEKNMQEFEKFINKTFDKWQKKVLDAVKVALEKVTTIDDLCNMEYNYDNYLEDMIVKSELIAYDNEFILDTIEFSNPNNFNTRNLNGALDYFLKKYPAMYDDIENTIEYSRHKYFYMKKVTDINMTERFMKSLARNIENGGTFEDWIKDRGKLIEEAGLKNKEGYLKTVYRTNLSQAYNAAIYKKQLKYKDRYPYIKYCGTIDGREQEHTRQLDGKIFKVGSAEADAYYPPNGYNCRCYTVSLTAEEVEGKLDNDVVDGEIKGLDLKDFEGNVGNEEYVQQLEEKYEIKSKDFNKAKKRRQLIENNHFDRKGKYKNAVDIENLYSIIDMKDLTYEEHGAIETYSGKMYQEINEALRTGKINKKTEKIVNLIDSGIAKGKLKEDIQVFRGISNSKYADFLINKGEKLIGEDLKDNAFYSTSLSFSIAKKSFTKNLEKSVIFNIKVPKGKKAFFMSEQDSIFPEQLELLFERNTKVKVTKVYKINKLMIIEGEMK